MGYIEVIYRGIKGFIGVIRNNGKENGNCYRVVGKEPR